MDLFLEMMYEDLSAFFCYIESNWHHVFYGQEIL